MELLGVEQLLASCNSNDPAKQAVAIMELQDLKAYSAVPTLLKLLASSEGNIRGLAVEALGHLGRNNSVSVGYEIMKTLADPEALVRDEAVNALARLDCKPSLELIQTLLQDDSAWIVRASAAEALGDLAEIGDLKTLQALESALEDSILPIRAYAACSIGIIGTPNCLPKLQERKAIEDSQGTKAEILIAMYRLGERNQLEEFLNLLDEADELLVMTILNILEDLASRRVPEYFPSDSPRFRKLLFKVIQTFPNQKNRIEEVIGLLESLEALLVISDIDQK